MCHIVLVAASIGNLFNSVFVNSVVFVDAPTAVSLGIVAYTLTVLVGDSVDAKIDVSFGSAVLVFRLMSQHCFSWRLC